MNKHFIIITDSGIGQDRSLVLMCKCGWNSERLIDKEAFGSFANHVLESEADLPISGRG